MKRCDAFSLLVSDALDRARRIAGTTQTTLATRAKLSRRAVGMALDGHTVHTSTIARIADGLDCDVVVTLRPRARARTLSGTPYAAPEHTRPS